MGRRGRPMMNRMSARQGPKQQRKGLGPKLREGIKEARALVKADNFAAASEAFVKLSKRAEKRDHRRAALRFGFAAARTSLKANNADQALTLAKSALSYASGAKRPRKIGKVVAKLVKKFEQAGHTQAATELQEAAQQALGLKTLPQPKAQTLNRTMRRQLPKQCTTCGDAIDPTEVEFDDEGADCPMCGAGLI
ncbi:MAG: hypothetical protein HN348_02170 [Proteobacteria bacterium]|jgi:hypothetical protein|nr:hypothetical protein [Pseudomonadota bacterium]